MHTQTHTHNGSLSYTCVTAVFMDFIEVVFGVLKAKPEAGWGSVLIGSLSSPPSLHC